MDSSKIKTNKTQIAPFREDIGNSKASLRPLILAKQVLIKGESRREFTGFVAQITSENPCTTIIEEEFLKKYIFSLWKLKRMRQIERNLLNQQQAFTEDELLFSAKKHRVRNIVRIRINDEIKAVLEQQEKLEKQIVKALKQLREEKRLNRGT